jgi:hypothetical protein
VGAYHPPEVTLKGENEWMPGTPARFSKEPNNNLALRVLRDFRGCSYVESLPKEMM